MAVQNEYRRYVLFRGIVNDFDDEYNEVDLAELDARAYNMRSTINHIEPNRDPHLEVDYLGISGNIELIFNFRTTWMDRQSDLADYLDDVQSEIENEMDLLITDREMLGVREM